MEIIEKKEHPLLSRTEVIAKDSYTGATPSRDSINERLANVLKANKELLVIKHIYPKFGFGNAKIIAYLYSNKKDMERIEPEYAFKKGVSKKGEEKKAEEKKQDKPKAEEKKEEVKPEQEKEKLAEQKKQDESKPEEKKQDQKQEGKKEQSPDKPSEEKKS